MSNWATPTSVGEACELLRATNSQALAGGVAVTNALRKGDITPRKIVSLGEIRQLKGITGESQLSIGAMTTLAQLAVDARIYRYEPQLREMFADIGNQRVRCAGTIGGSLAEADPRHDPQPLLAVLGAEAVIESGQGQRRVPLLEFSTGLFATELNQGELLARIDLPERPARLRVGWCKLHPDRQQDYGLVSLALSFEITNLVIHAPRVVVGASDTHVRPHRAAQALDGVRLDGIGGVSPDVVEEMTEMLCADIQAYPSSRVAAGGSKRELIRLALTRALARTRGNRFLRASG